MSITLNLTDLILLVLVQAVITANLVLAALYLRDVYIQRKADAAWAREQNAYAIGWDNATTDEIIAHLNDDLPY